MRPTLLVLTIALFACVPPAEEAPAIDPSSLVLPGSTSAIEANADLPTVILTKKKLLVVGVSRASMDVPFGVESREGPIITPLRGWLKDPSIHGKDVAVAFDSDVTADAAMQVLATCLDAGMSVFHIAVSQNGATAQIPLEFGKPDPPGAKLLTASIFRGGVILKVAAGNIAPGCDGLGEGVTVSRIDGIVARERLAKCIARVHAEHHTNLASIIVTKDTEFHDIVDVLDSIRHDAETDAISLGISQ